MGGKKTVLLVFVSSVLNDQLIINPDNELFI